MVTSQTGEKKVYALDIGVYKTRNDSEQVLAKTTAAWARLSEGVNSFQRLEYEGNPTEGRFYRSGDPSSTHPPIACGRSIPKLSEAIARDMSEENLVALGFEAPMWFPVKHKHHAGLDLFQPRVEEEGSIYRWYHQSGAAATLKATSLGILLLKDLERRLSKSIRLTTRVEGWKPSTLILYESFVAGEYKVDPGELPDDEWDALTSALAWGKRHVDFVIPEGYEARSLHSCGSFDGHALSVWDHIAGEVDGPKDCEVVALSSQ